MKKNKNKIEFRNWFLKELEDVLDKSECQEIFFRLLEHNGVGRLDWATRNEIEVDEIAWTQYVDQLKLDKPVQYILGYEYFAGEKFAVNEDVLIPRPETEELVNWIIDDNREQSDLRILEIGTGSACIAVTLAKRMTKVTMVATDISQQALAVAKKNASTMQVDIDFLEDDILQTCLQAPFDIIVSNPPYIPIDEAILIEERVKDYEPHQALFTEENNPLQFYKAILDFAKNNIRENGRIYFETHEDYAEDVRKLAGSFHWDSTIRKDIYGKNRMVRIGRE